MKQLGDLATAAVFFAAVGREFVGYQDELEAAATILEKQAKDLIGVPQPEWAPLAPATLERKGGVNTPLLETGEMRDSITHNADAHEAHVGSNNPKLKWHEFGSIKLGGAWGGPNPPRPVLGVAMVRAEPAIKDAVGKVVMERLVKE